MADEAPANPTPPARRNRRWLRLAIGLPLLAAVWYFVGTRLWTSVRQIDWKAIDVNWAVAILAMASLLTARLANGMNCRHVLSAMGERARYRDTIPIIWSASLGRYLPGKMAVVAGAAYMLARRGVRLAAALAALFLSGMLMVLVGLLACTPLLLTRAMREKFPMAWAAALAMLAVGAVCMHPRIFSRLCNIALRKTKRPALPEALATGPYLAAIGMNMARAALIGLALWLTARSLSPIGFGGYPIALAAAGAATVASFLAPFAPAGIGVHELIFLVALGPLMSAPAVGLMVILFRLFNLAVDAVAGATGMVLLRRSSPCPDPTSSSSAPPSAAPAPFTTTSTSTRTCS